MSLLDRVEENSGAHRAIRPERPNGNGHSASTPHLRDEAAGPPNISAASAAMGRNVFVVRLDRAGSTAFREWCRSVPILVLVAIDMLGKVRPPKRNGQSDYDADYEACEGLQKLAAEFGLSTRWPRDAPHRGREEGKIEKAVMFDRETCRWAIIGKASEVENSSERTGC